MFTAGTTRIAFLATMREIREEWAKHRSLLLEINLKARCGDSDLIERCSAQTVQ